MRAVLLCTALIMATPEAALAQTYVPMSTIISQVQAALAVSGLNGIPIGQTTAAPGTFTVETTEPAIVHGTNGSLLGSDNDLVSDLVESPSADDVEVARFSQIDAYPAAPGAAITGGGHLIGLGGDAVDNGLATPLMIGVEGFLSLNQYAGQNASAGQAADFVGHMIGLCPTCSIGTLYGGYIVGQGDVHGSVGTWADWGCVDDTVGSGGTIGAQYCLLDTDPDKSIHILATETNSTGEELGPTAGAQAVAGRVYFGIQRGAATGNVPLLNTFIWWSPLLISQRTAFSAIGANITAATGVAGTSCDLAVYEFVAGEPAGPLATASISAQSTGPETAPISVTLDAGVYLLGAMCSQNTIALGGYTENAMPSLFGTSSDTNVDWMPLTGVATYGTWPTAPTLSYVSSATYPYAPRIWLEAPALVAAHLLKARLLPRSENGISPAERDVSGNLPFAQDRPLPNPNAQPRPIHLN